MPEILLFTKPGCQKCDYIKEKMPKGLGVQIVDMSSAEGLAEAAYFEILHKNAPILIVDEQRFEGAIPILERLKMFEQCNGES